MALIYLKPNRSAECPELFVQLSTADVQVALFNPYTEDGFVADPILVPSIGVNRLFCRKNQLLHQLPFHLCQYLLLE